MYTFIYTSGYNGIYSKNNVSENFHFSINSMIADTLLNILTNAETFIKNKSVRKPFKLVL